MQLKSLSVLHNQLPDAVSFLHGFLKELLLPSLQSLALAESISPAGIERFLRVGRETGVSSLKTLSLLSRTAVFWRVDCGLDSRAVFELNSGILSGAFPRLRELTVEGGSFAGVSSREGSVFVPRGIFVEFAAETRRIHRHPAYPRGFFPSILVVPHGGNVETVETVDSAGLVSLLFRDPEMRHVHYRGDGSESLSILFADRSFGCSQSRFESIALSRAMRWAFRIRCPHRVLDAAAVPHRPAHLAETPRAGRYLRFHD